MGLFEMKDMYQKARTLQTELKKKQDELSRQMFEGESAGGKIKVVVNGNNELISLTIDPALVSQDNVAALQSLVTKAVNDGFHRSQKAAQKSLSGMMGGMGGFGGLADLLKS